MYYGVESKAAEEISARASVMGEGKVEVGEIVVVAWALHVQACCCVFFLAEFVHISLTRGHPGEMIWSNHSSLLLGSLVLL
jgi:hypothetical protein